MSSDKAEFAKFFNLLVHLASKENREDFSVPRDLTLLLQKFETAPSNDKDVMKPSHASQLRHSRRNSHAVAKFPLDEEYQFTFKLMIHKLYDMDGWAEKVKEVVEKSQCLYRPLTEELKHSPRSSQDKSMEHDKDVQIRAIKKRCTGRTRAISGPSFVPEPGWIYNATRAVNETSGNEGKRRRNTLSPPQPSMIPDSRPRYQSLNPSSTKVSPLRCLPIDEAPKQPNSLTHPKALQFAALSNDAFRVGARNFQVKLRVRSSTLSVAPTTNDAIIGTKRRLIPC